MAAAAGSGCPFRRLLQLLSLHLSLLLLLVSFGASACHDTTKRPTASTFHKCPLYRTSKFAAAFLSPSAPPVTTHAASITHGGLSAAVTCPFYCTAAAAGLHAYSVASFPRPYSDGGSSTLRRRRPRAIPCRMSATEGTNQQQATSPASGAAVKLGTAAAAGPKRKEGGSSPLQVHVIGLSHHNAAVEVRERLAVPEADWNAESSALCGCPNIMEAAVLSTCNRFEVYIASADGHAAIHEAVTHLHRRSGLPHSTLRRSLFMLSGDDALAHVLRVSAGLDSLVVGEGQILSQVRQCYLHGTDEDGSAGKVVARLLNTAVSAGKRARAETAIAKGAVSISSAAAEFSKFRCEADLHRHFGGARIAVVGAGTMSRLLLVHLQSLGVTDVTLVSRGAARARALVGEFPDINFNLKFTKGEEGEEEGEGALGAALCASDIVYTSTSATECIVTCAGLEALGVGREHPVMLVDIAVPRNVAADCNAVPGVFAYDVDDLKMVVARNTALRRKEMLEAEGILEEEGGKFRGWQQSLTAIPAIAKMQEKFEAMRAEEFQKAANKLNGLNPKEIEVVEKLSKGIVNKMLHGPMSALRAPEGPEQKRRTLQLLKHMFRLGAEIGE